MFTNASLLSDIIYQVEPKYEFTRIELKSEYVFILYYQSSFCRKLPYQTGIQLSRPDVPGKFLFCIFDHKTNPKKSWKIFRIWQKVIENCTYAAAQFHFALWQPGPSQRRILKFSFQIQSGNPQCSTLWFYCLRLAQLSGALKFNLLVTTLNSAIG